MGRLLNLEYDLIVHLVYIAIQTGCLQLKMLIASAVTVMHTPWSLCASTQKLCSNDK